MKCTTRLKIDIGLLCSVSVESWTVGTGGGVTPLEEDCYWMELQNVNVATQPSLEGAWWLLCEMGHATDNETKAATALVDAVHKRKCELSSQGRCTSTRVHAGTQSFQSSVGSPCAFWSKRGATQRCVSQPYVVLYVLRSRVQVELCVVYVVRGHGGRVEPGGMVSCCAG